MIKKILITFFTIITIMVLNNTIFCDDKVYVEGTLNYVIQEDGTIKVVGYYGEDKEVVVPSFIGFDENNNPRLVVAVGKDAFVYTNAETVILPETVSYIEEGSISENIEIKVADSYDEIKRQEGKEPSYEEESKPIVVEENHDTEEETESVEIENIFENEPEEGVEEEESSQEVEIKEDIQETSNDVEEPIDEEFSVSPKRNYIVIAIIPVIAIIVFLVLRKRNK